MFQIFMSKTQTQNKIIPYLYSFHTANWWPNTILCLDICRCSGDQVKKIDGTHFWRGKVCCYMLLLYQAIHQAKGFLSMSGHGNTFCITGPLCRESTHHQLISPHHWPHFLSARKSSWTEYQNTGNVKCHSAHGTHCNVINGFNKFVSLGEEVNYMVV